MRLVVCTVGGWRGPWGLPASVHVHRDRVGGGELSLYELAVAAAAGGVEVELRGEIDPTALERISHAAEATPKLDLHPRLPTEEDLVVVPEGWADPVAYARIALSPARGTILVMGPPGLFGWPFVRAWTPPEPLTAPREALARPEHFRAMVAMGFEIWTGSAPMREAANEAGVDCRWIGHGIPFVFPTPATKRHDVAVAGNSRWSGPALRIMETMGLEPLVIRDASFEEELRMLGESRLLLHPMIAEGWSRIVAQARAMGCVPVMRYAKRAGVAGEEHGTILVDESRMLDTITGLLANPERLEELSQRARESAREELAWQPFVGRLSEAIAASPPDDPGRSARAGMGQAFEALLANLERRVADSEKRFDQLRNRRSVRIATRVADVLGRGPRRQ